MMKRLVKKSFTMAEILLSLTIIGVVAAITLPSLTGNINERTWNTQKRALYARLSQGIALVSSLNDSDTAEGFVTSQLSKVLKINNVCDNAHLQDCGINSAMLMRADGNQFGTGFPKTWNELGLTNFSFSYASTAGANSASQQASANAAQVAAFETQNGESIVLFYNPNCASDMEYTADQLTGESTAQDTMTNVCLNLIYDLNSLKGPNTVGQDIGFMTAYYPSDAVLVSPEIATSNTALDACAEGYRAPNIHEAASIMLNYGLLTSSAAPDVLLSSTTATGYKYRATKVLNNKNIYVRTVASNGASGVTRCIKR